MSPLSPKTFSTNLVLKLSWNLASTLVSGCGAVDRVVGVGRGGRFVDVAGPERRQQVHRFVGAHLEHAQLGVLGQLPAAVQQRTLACIGACFGVAVVMAEHRAEAMARALAQRRVLGGYSSLALFLDPRGVPPWRRHRPPGYRCRGAAALRRSKPVAWHRRQWPRRLRAWRVLPVLPPLRPGKQWRRSANSVRRQGKRSCKSHSWDLRGRTNFSISFSFNGRSCHIS